MAPGASAPWSDARVVNRCLEGDEAAWSELLARYRRLIYSIPIKYGLSPDQASDIFQEVCVELVAELSRLREPRALPKWLMQVTAHKCTRLLQRDLRGFAGADSDTEHRLQSLADPGLSSDEVLLEVEREQSLRVAVAALTPRCRRLVQMLFYEMPPRPYREIADSLALASGSIGFIRGRCLERLRTSLEKFGVL